MSSKPKLSKSQRDSKTHLADAKLSADIANLYLQGKRQYEIAEILKVGTAMVQRRLSDLREAWKADAQSVLAERLALELAKIDRLEAVAWEEWERSREDGKIKFSRTEMVPKKEDNEEGDEDAADAKPVRGAAQSTTGAGRSDKDKRNTPLKSKYAPAPAKMIVLKNIEEERSIGRLGDERYLGRVAWCIETRCKLLGMMKNEVKLKVGGGAGDVQINWSLLVNPDAAEDEIERKIESVRTALPESVETSSPTPKPSTNGVHGHGEANGKHDPIDLDSL